MEIKSTGKKHRVFSTGAQRDNAIGKGLPTLVSPLFETELWRHLEAGAAKYAPRNWEQGLPLCSILDSLLRHVHAERMGDTSENHLGAIACNAMFYVHTKRAIEQGLLPQELDDMPKYKRADSRPDYRAMGYCGPCTETILAANVGDAVRLCTICRSIND